MVQSPLYQKEMRPAETTTHKHTVQKVQNCMEIERVSEWFLNGKLAHKKTYFSAIQTLTKKSQSATG